MSSAWAHRADSRANRIGAQLTRLPVLVEASRGPAVGSEIRHAGAIAVVDGEGNLMAGVGDVNAVFPLRSTTKPIQLLPYLLDGLHRDRPRAGQELLPDLAVMMSSHAGELMHTQRVSGILQAYGLSPQALLCGAHWPYSAAARNALIRGDESPGNLHSNCSGKHTGMLAVCVRNGWPLESYVDAEHPLQRRINSIVAVLSRSRRTPLPHSVDGCSLPTHWVTMRGLAHMYAALAYPEGAPEVEQRPIGEELELLFTAGTRHPEMVAGNGFFDTRLMTSFGGRVLAKGGAAGVYAMAVAPTNAFPHGLGIAFKVEDGDGDARARPIIACEILRQLNIAPENKATAESLEALAGATVLNVRRMRVGEYRCLFQLR
ncbi:MAG: asparaginase [Xanthomonadales bacterium]|nr:asparaginase [Xanthomonadales bacterium]